MLGAFAQKKEILKKQPNIILIMADDLGYGDVGFNGNENVMTPHLDNMSKEGVTLTNFYAAAPLCSPTRASVLTGRSPFRQGIFAAHTGGMRPAETTIPELLKKVGYQTGFFGKWHLGWVEPDQVESRGNYSPPWHHGYDETFATKSAVPTWNPTKTPKGWTSWGAMEDGSWGGSVYVQNGKPVTDNLDGDDSRIIMDRAIPFMEKSISENKPFLATIWFHTPHEPVVAGPEYLAKYPNLPEGQKHLYGCITAMDDQIGRLRSFLKEKNIDDNTIIFFTSDNGPSGPITKKGIASAGPFRGHKHLMYEGGLRVPSIALWPNHTISGLVSDFQSSTVDYLPTILDILDIPVSKKILLDGVSFKSVILDGNTEKRTVPIAAGYKRLHGGTDIYAYVSGDYKICIPNKGEKMMLFNLKQDPGESNDLAEEKPELLKKMSAELEKIKDSWRLSNEGNDYQW
ncbi:N-acetylgalactosamine 6-sulfatase [Pseudalgibacter alginicilyticus]|uniref:N-acetylgalactosamine 6-sulfatase n=2 Tax=Pseudalgibacter alginicilyticus TaxID=1736674 RepID=A0A0P0D9B4_9FLAO|nr:N-acetylgalactosamine 6-sulfatase [Pseudalgibacter alginicilyticus]